MNNRIQEFYGRGPSGPHSSYRDQVPQGFHEGRNPGRRSIVPQPYDGEGHYSVNSGQHGGPRQKHKLPNVSLQDAMMDLYDQLKGAERFYFHFRQDFENDTIRIKPYASSDVLGYLWASKVGESDNPRTRNLPHSAELRDGFENEGKNLREGFRVTGKQIGRLFRIAITAADRLKSQRPTLESRIDPSNAARISDKLKSVYKDVTALLGSASRRVEDVQYLLTDLEMAATFLKGNGDERARMSEDGRSEMQDPGAYHGNDDVGPGGFGKGEGRLMLKAIGWHPLTCGSRKAIIETEFLITRLALGWFN